MVMHNGDTSRQLMCLSLLITDRFGESTSDSARQAAQVGGIPLKASNVPPPVDYRALIWHEQMTDLESRWWMSDWACVMERGGRSMRQKEREKERWGVSE